METKKNRSTFSGKVGFVLAAAGSAVGLGNLWRFPYLAAKYGGGIFLLVYIVLAVTFGFTLMVTEIAIGRKTRLSPMEAFGSLNKKWSWMGKLVTLVPVLILPYYCVIGGWVTKYTATMISGAVQDAAGDNYFSTFISGTGEPLLWFLLFMTATAVIVFLGVEKGIEKFSRVLMPALLILTILLSIFVVTRPGAGAGVAYYLKPDFSKLSMMTVLAALGQLFFSMSLAMGIMITYGSYLRKQDHIEQSVRQIEVFDTLVAFLAGLMIVPAVFVYSGGDESALGKGPSLMFVTLPKVFAEMKIGSLIGAGFFILVLFAALTSSIALTESAVSTLQDELHWSRRKATSIMGVSMVLLGSLSSLGYGPLANVTVIGMQFLDFFDFLTNSVMMPIAAIASCILVSRVIGVARIADEVTLNGALFRRRKVFNAMIRFLCPFFAAIILISSIASAFGWISM